VRSRAACPATMSCASFGSDEEHQAIVGPWPRRALRDPGATRSGRYAIRALRAPGATRAGRCGGGERFLYFRHSSDEPTIRRFLLEQAGNDVEAGLTLGQIEIHPIERDRFRIDPEAMIASRRPTRAPPRATATARLREHRGYKDHRADAARIPSVLRARLRQRSACEDRRKSF
jgi:hypothetical protein